ncbi:MAG: NAD-dependent protein deacylase [Bacilli bacterium]|nr:NAD-dependent protein deacylase [Bacilli bacterium]
MNPENVSRIKDALQKSRLTVFLGGAGVSVASGIPDFRSPGGLYSQKRADGRRYEELLSSDYFFEDTKGFYDFYWEKMVAPLAKPNAAHLALAEFERSHSLAILTQNIDGLHQMAGSKRVYELHGTTARYHCLGCGKKFGIEELERHGVPHCPHCGGIIKPDVVLYGEGLPEDALFGGIEAVSKADVLLVAGTSLRVYPVASIPQYFRGGLAVIFNAEPTPQDVNFDIVVRDDLTTALPEVLR